MATTATGTPPLSVSRDARDSAKDVGEEASHLQYDRRRREQLLSLMLPITATVLTIGGIFFATSLVFTSPLVAASASGAAPALYVQCAAVVLFAAFCWLGTLVLRRNRLGLATGIMVAVVGGGFPLLVVLRDVTIGLDAIGLAQFMIFGITLVLIGMLGDRATIIASTLLLNGATILLIILAPARGGLDASWPIQQPIVLATTLIFEWFFAGFILAQWNGYQHTLRDLGDAFAQSQQLEKLKDQFITHVNHELRTPIMTLDGYVELLHEARHQMSEHDQGVALEQASRTGKVLVGLLESILDIRRIDDTAVLDPQIVDVYQVLETAQALLDPREGGLAGRDLHFDIPSGLAVWGEPLRVQQILTNLLSNAIKYSAPGSALVVQALRVTSSAPVSLAPQHPGDPRAQVEIRVRDFGLGIPPEQIPLLFHRFVRLPRDMGSNIGGNGLGLYLCRVFADAMGGSIRVESSGISGEGSTFILRLPDATKGSQAEALTTRLHVGESARPFVAADLHDRRIALEDYRGRRLLLAFLRFAGCPFCGLMAHDLTMRSPAFQEDGLDVLVVIESTREHTMEQPVLREAPFPIVPDPTGALYRLYGAPTSPRGLQVALRDRKEKIAQAQQQGFDGLVNGGPAHGDGVLDRLPAEFVIGPDLQVELAHYGKDIGDFLSLEIVTRHLQLRVGADHAGTQQGIG